MGRVEHLGNISCDGDITRMFAVYGYHIRD